jgi:hypothetical protein
VVIVPDPDGILKRRSALVAEDEMELGDGFGCKAKG